MWTDNKGQGEMAIYYYAVDKNRKQYFSAPRSYAYKSPGIYHPENPFPHMVIMKNIKGCCFDILDDCSNDIPPGKGYQDITEEVYLEYLESFKEYFQQPERSKREDMDGPSHLADRGWPDKNAGCP